MFLYIVIYSYARGCCVATVTIHTHDENTKINLKIDYSRVLNLKKNTNK